MRSLLTALCAGFAAVAPVLAASEFSLVEDQRLFTIKYKTDSAKPHNWIGIYNKGDGPSDGERKEDALGWKWASWEEGEVVIPPHGWGKGKYEAYFLADGKYESLADSFEVEVPKHSLELLEDEEGSTFLYSTTDQNETNWLAIFTEENAPNGKGKKNGEPSAWAYAKDSSGRITLPTQSMGPGEYKAFLMSTDSYDKLADIDVQLSVRFLAHQGITMKPCVEGEMCEVYIWPLVPDEGGPKLEYAVLEGPSWLETDGSGIAWGTPDEAGDVTVRVQTTHRDPYSSDELEITVPVLPKDEIHASKLRVMTLNVWKGGEEITNHNTKLARFILENNVDIIALQEAGPIEDLKNLMFGLFDYETSADGKTVIMSRYFVDDNIAWDDGLGVTVRVGGYDDHQKINVWNVHLAYENYGPYSFCFEGMSADEVIQLEANRTAQIQDTIDRMGQNLTNSDKEPVLLMGDFNAPSQLDWTEQNKHCGVGSFEWPTSAEPLKAGLVDSLREADSDPKESPHNTWSPIYKQNTDFDSKEEPQDRIDFIYHKGSGMKVKSGETLVLGKPKPIPFHEQNEWVSDHMAVLVEYEI